jgi:hypothetical protein
VAKSLGKDHGDTAFSLGSTEESDFINIKEAVSPKQLSEYFWAILGCLHEENWATPTLIERARLVSRRTEAAR